jgi:hypothetical protein
LGATSLAGCAPDYDDHLAARAGQEAAIRPPPRALPHPDSRLMRPQLQPTCEPSTPPPAADGPDAELARRIRTDYDVACYRQAEAVARERLRQLQEWVAKTLASARKTDTVHR